MATVDGSESPAYHPPTPEHDLTDPTQRRFRGSANINDYQMVQEKLGEGTFGLVSKATSKRTGQMMALKKIIIHNEKDGFPITALREVKLLKMLSHPNILTLEEMAVERQPPDEKGKRGKKRATLYMVTPYMDHDLSGMLTNPDIGAFSPGQVKCYMLQLLEGVRYLHDSHILHRDMKAANILIANSGLLQIADFGLARHYDGPTPQPGQGNGKAVRDYTSLVVTRWYRPPELLLSLRQYTPAIDIWGVGCVFAEMFERKPILEGRTDVDQCVRIFELLGSPNENNMPGWSELPGCEGHRDWARKSGNIDNRFGRALGREGLDLLKKLLCLNWRERINAFDALDHVYFKIDPKPTPPGQLPRFKDSHELDSRIRGQEKSQALPPAPKGGTVGNNEDLQANFSNGYNYNNFNDRYRGSRDPPPRRDNRGYDDRGSRPPGMDGRPPGWRQIDRGPPSGPPRNGGHPLPARPDYPPPPYPDRGPPGAGHRYDSGPPLTRRDEPPPTNRGNRGGAGGRNRDAADTDSYIPNYDADAPPPPRAGGYREDVPVRGDDRRPAFRDRDRDRDMYDDRGPSRGASRELDPRAYRDQEAPRERTRSRSPGRRGGGRQGPPPARERDRELYRR
ncbi:hypothetical protein MBLNU230_g2735t1 [Neophaeotheca triangularis]